MRVLRGRHMLLGVPMTGTLLPYTALGQDVATPGPFPQTPDPAACVTQALTVEQVLSALDNPPATSAAATPDAVATQGESADAATADAVRATPLQVFACANAGDRLRFASLYTDQFPRDFFDGVPQADLRAFLGTPSQPLPVEQRRVIRGLGEVKLLTDEPDLVILRQVDGQWLVDEIHEDAGAGT